MDSVRAALRCALFVLAVVGVVGAGAPARAEPHKGEAEARARYASGLRLVEAGDYERARVELEASYALAPYPGILLVIADCEERLKRPEAALARYEQFLAAAPRSQRRQAIEEKIAALRAAMAPPEPPPAPHVEPPPPVAAAPAPVPAPVPTLAASVVAKPAPSRPRVPLHRRGWLWGVVVGGAALVGGAIALGVTLGTARRDPTTPIMDVAF